MHAILAVTAIVTVAGAQEASVKPEDCRIRHRGNIQDSGAFSFWDDGRLGDWFVREGEGNVTATVVAWGKTIGEAPTLGVEVVRLDGVEEEVARIPVTAGQASEFEVELPVEGGFFGLQFRHLNRSAGEGNENLRHLMISEVRVAGARLSEAGLTEYAFFGEGGGTVPQGEGEVIETQRLRMRLWAEDGGWSIEHKPSGTGVEGVRPVLHLGGAETDLGEYEVTKTVMEGVEDGLGQWTAVRLEYQRDGGPEVIYEVLLSAEGDEALARLALANTTDAELLVSRLAPVVGEVRLGGQAADWSVIGDAKANSHPYETVRGGDLESFESWWYAAAKNLETKRSLVLGSLTNSKGLGRFVVLPGSEESMRAAAYLDYEAAVMPAGARIDGEWMLVHLGERGTDGLERLGDLIAKANGIDLARDHPLDPYTPEGVDIFNTWNSYGSGVVKGFDYKHNRGEFKAPYMDPEWTKANRERVLELGLQHFGYARTGPVRVSGVATPLARRYGQPDFWFKAAEKISQEHPELYVDGRADFSNPQVIEFERQRVEESFAGKTGTLRHGLDFTNDWRKLKGQHDPFMTSAETYRACMGLWRERGRQHTHPLYCLIWMNTVGMNYDMVDVIHIGHDSDQGYGGKGLTFTHGLTRQISGRYFYNGQVWWNSPDSYHVYAGGLYSYEQGKVHASYCSLSGNLVHLAEPLSDEEIPEDRLDIIRRVAPTTADTARAVDVFENNPARLWDMRVTRPFGQWHVVGLFNVDYEGDGKAITEEVRFEDLGLDPNREYLVYEFWSRQFLGVQKGGFTRTLAAPDCEIYAIVEKLDRPVLMSTSRHVRQMAYDVLDLEWDEDAGELRGTSRVVQNDPYELRLYVPEGRRLESATAEGMDVTTAGDNEVVRVGFTAEESSDVEWVVRFGEA